MRTFTWRMTPDGHYRYWSIELLGTSITIDTGRIGGTGGSTRETQTLSFADEVSARTEHDRLVAVRPADARNWGWGYSELILQEPDDPACERVFTASWVEPNRSEVHRFWNLIQDGATLSFTWGDSRTFPDSAETETLTFADEGEARRERDKRIARKITESYHEVIVTRAPPVASPFAPSTEEGRRPPHALWRHLVREDGPPCDLYVRDGSIYSRDTGSRPPIRWQGEYSLERLERLVEQKKAEGYREAEPTLQPGPMQAALEAAVEADPDNVAARMAYADWLTEQPDPVLRARGEFVQVQLALVDASLSSKQREGLRQREADLMEQNAEAWCGLFADEETKVEFAFDRGWVRVVSIKEREEDAERIARALRAWPLARLLAELELSRDDPVPHLVGAPFVGHLRRLTLGEPDTGRGAGVALAPFLTGAVRLEQLEVFWTGLDMHDLFALPFPRLRELTVHGCEEAYPLEVLAANPSLARLQAVRFWPHHLRARAAPYISAESACALFRSPHLTGLRCVAIYQSELGDEGCSALVESGLLGRLEVLDLDMGRISDAGARLLAGCPDLPRLKRLVLTHNQLTEAGIAALQATGVPLEANGQFSADQIDGDQVHLMGGDFE